MFTMYLKLKFQLPVSCILSGKLLLYSIVYPICQNTVYTNVCYGLVLNKLTNHPVNE